VGMNAYETVGIYYSKYSYISECNFTRNKGNTRGGNLRIYGHPFHSPTELAVIRKSHFIENEGESAGGIHIHHNKKTNISECSFKGNKG
jgi:hypothetical protein